MAFLEGQAAIRYPVDATATSPGNAFFQDVLPVAHRRRSASPGSRSRPPGCPPDAVRRALGPGHRRPARLRDPRRDRRRAGVVDARPPADPRLGRGSRPRSSSASGPSSGSGPDRDDVVPGACPRRRPRARRDGVALAATAMRPRDERAELAGSAGDLRRRLGAGQGRERPARRLAGSSRTVGSSSPALLFGLACTSRLTVVFAAPFFLLVGSAGRGCAAAGPPALGAGIPIGRARRLQPRDDRSRDPSGLPAPVRARGRRSTSR